MHLHELIFGAFLLLTAGRLFAAGAAGLALTFAGMTAAIGLMTAAGTRWPSPGMARARLLQFPVLVNVVYPLLGTVALQLHPDKCDAALLRVDRVLCGTALALRLDGWSHPVLTEILSACYLLFFPAVLTAFAVAVIRPEPNGVRLYNGLIGVYALGFLGYTMVPASGPHLAMPEAFSAPLAGGPLTDFNAALVSAGSNKVDVFPSLHVAITVLLTGWLWRRDRRLFLCFLAPAAGLCAATLYLRYHYAIDVAAGLVLAAIGLWLGRFPDKSYELHPPFR